MLDYMDKLPIDKDVDVIVQTNKDVYHCRWVDGELNWPVRYSNDGTEYPIRWTEDVGA